MNYHNITVDDMLNGDGLRTVLWVSGCMHHCRGCQNPQTWDDKSGIPFDEAAKEELFADLSRDYMDGITFSGGDPLCPANRETVGQLIAETRDRFPQKTIWLYTGDLFESSAYAPLSPADDVIVDGPYVEAREHVNLRWRGSKTNASSTLKRR